MSVPSEPEKYSIDQMMDRLKNRREGDPLVDGTLVTRADGSQAVRVRMKKRRSHQLHKEQRRSQHRARMLQVSGALVLVLLALFGSGVAIVFANSAPFREGLVRKIALCSGAGAELHQFRMNPTSANASALTLTWPAGNVLGSLKARNLYAEISPVSFLGKSMVGEEVRASEATLTLRIPQADKPSREIPASEGIQPVRFNHYNLPKLHILVGNPSAPGIRMHGSEASFIPQNPNGRPQLLLSRGDLTIKGWPKLQMDRSHIEFRGNDADIIGMRLRHVTDPRGVFELSGTLSPYATNQASTLAVQLDSYLVAGIAGTELGRLFSGRIDTVSSSTSNYLSFTPGPDPSPSLSVTFRNSLASVLEVTGFPFLFGLSQTLDDEWFARPVFDSEIRGILRRVDGNVSIENLNLENKGRMALRGMVAMTPNRILSGKLEVGVAQGMIQSSENPRLDALFGPPRDNFRWLTLKISGNTNSPADNFKDLYESNIDSKATAPADRIPSFEDLTRPK